MKAVTERWAKRRLEQLKTTHRERMARAMENYLRAIKSANDMRAADELKVITEFKRLGGEDLGKRPSADQLTFDGFKMLVDSML